MNASETSITSGLPTVQPDGPKLLDALEQFLSSYALLPDGMSLVLALYAIMTYCFEMFDAIAYIAVTSPTKGCGKTRVLELLSFLCNGPVSTVGITPAALFRVIQAKKPTLLVDESETFSGRTDKAEALREVSNAGYKKGQKVLRCDERQGERGSSGEKYPVREFDVFGPKVFALIGRLPATLADRSIGIRMQRTREKLARYRRAQVVPTGKALKGQIETWIATEKDQVKAWYESHDVEFLEGRSEELWLPLFAICSVIAPGREVELESIARQLVGIKEADGSDEITLRLLTDIRSAFDSGNGGEMFSADICGALNAEREWPYWAWNHGLGIGPSDLARRLHPFDISSRNLREGEKVKKGYRREDFESAWEAYLPPAETRYAATDGINIEPNEGNTPATVSLCSDGHNAQSASIDAGCSAVAESESI